MTLCVACNIMLTIRRLNSMKMIVKRANCALNYTVMSSRHILGGFGMIFPLSYACCYNYFMHFMCNLMRLALG